MTTKRYVTPNTLILNVSNCSQKWKGLFRSPFVLQMIAAHLMAIEGSSMVPGLHAKPTTVVVGGLGLATASVRVVYHACRVALIIDRWRGLSLSLPLEH
jgi:hypothetical protein